MREGREYNIQRGRGFTDEDFFNLWNEYNSETFRILDHLVNDTENDKEEPLNSMTCFDGDVMIVVPVEEEH